MVSAMKTTSSLVAFLLAVTVSAPLRTQTGAEANGLISGTRGMVSSAHPLASEAGAFIEDSRQSIPHHLTTREFPQAVKNGLAEGGVVCANLWDAEAAVGTWSRRTRSSFPRCVS